MFRYFSPLLLFFCFLVVSAAAQYGPMGIGNKNGTPTAAGPQPRLLLWLDGSSPAQQTNNGLVSTWNDKSGNEHHFTASGSNRPKFLAAGGPSGTPCLSFDGVDDRMICTDFEFPGSGYSIYFVIKTSDNNYGLFSYATPSQPYETVIYNNAGLHQRMLDTYDEPLTVIGNLSDGTWNYGGLLWDNSSNLWQYNQNNHSENSSAFANGITISNTGTAVIGDIQTTFGGGFTAPDALNGQIAEIILFEGFLNKGQTRLMRTYLWTKYGEDFNNSNVGWDKFHAFASGSGGQYYNPIGIGRDTGGSTGGAQSESRSDGLILRVNDGEWTYTQRYLCAATANAGPNPVVSTDLPPGVQQRWSRVWEVAGAFGNDQQFRVGFDFGEGINGDFPQNIENYVLLWRSDPNSGNFQIFNESDIAEKSIVDDEVIYRIKAGKIIGANRYYTIGTKNAAASSLTGETIQTWYAYQSGNWNNPTTWTLDGSAAPTYVNPSGAFPGNGDNVYIGSGRKVDVNINGINLNAVKVFGTLDVGVQAPPACATISGSGLIRCAGQGVQSNFPTGNSTAFADPLTGGTAEFYGNGNFTQTSPLEVNKLKLNFNSSTAELILATNLVHNGMFEVIKGVLRVNNSASVSRTLTSNARVLVESMGKILVSTAVGSASHTWYFYDDLINNGGVVKFTNRTSASDYNYTNNETQQYIQAVFGSGSVNQELRANGPSYFSRIVVDKGVDMTYVLTFSSINPSFFRLLGRCDYTMSDNPYINASDNKNAFALINGTAEIRENIFLPLSVNQANSSNYNINATAQLWINGGHAAKGFPVGPDTRHSQAIVNYGIIKVTGGVLTANCRSGITTRDNGITQIDGGVINAMQIRTSNQGAENIGGIIINGGVVNVDGRPTGTGSPNGAFEDYYTFSLTYPGNLFRMTGGELHITGPTNKGLVFINSDPENTTVTGGEIFLDVSSVAGNHKISTRAPLWNLTLTNSAGNNEKFTVIGGSSGSPAGTMENHQDLIIKNNLKISDAHTTLEMGTAVEAADLYLSGDLTINAGGLYIHNNNTTHFVGNSNSSLTFGGSNIFPFYNVRVNKNFDDRKVKIQNSGADPVMDILGSLYLDKGYFDNGVKNVELKGNIVNNSRFGDDGSTGYLRMNGSTGLQKIISNGGVFYKLVIDNPSGVELQNDGITAKTWVKLENGSLYIGDYKLRMETTVPNPILNFNGTDRFIVCSGNASAGGIEILNHQPGQQLVYPFGVSTGSAQKYVRADVYINNGFVDDGFIRITPVDTLLSTSNLDGTTDYLNFYWRVSATGYGSLPKVTHRFKYDQNDVRGTETAFESGRVLSVLPFTRSVDDSPASAHVNTGTGLIYFNGTDQAQGTTGNGTPLVNADYSAGAADRFTGSPEVYFSRSDTLGAAWDSPSNWSTCVGCTSPYTYHSTSATVAADYPRAGDIAIIGFNVSTLKPHVYSSTMADGLNVAEIRFTPLQDASGNRQPRYNGSSPGDLGILRPTLQIAQTSDIVNVRQISGEGELMLKGDIDLGVTDLGDFLAEDSSIVVINNGTLTPLTVNFLPPVIPNLFLAYTAPRITSDIHIRGNVEIAGQSKLFLSETPAGNIEIDGDLILNKYQSTASSTQVLFNKKGLLKTVEVHGDVKLLGSKSYIGINTLPGPPVTPVGWTPGEIEPQLWLDASDNSTVQKSGTSVTGWSNKGSDLTLSAVQNDPSKRPVQQTGGLNSLSTIHFDGVNDFLYIAHNPALNIAAGQDFELFSVVKSDVNPTQAAIIAKGGIDPGDYMLYFYSPRYKFYMDHGGIDMQADNPVGANANMGWARRQGNSGRLYNTRSGSASDNGVSSASTAANSHDVTIGAMSDGTTPARFFDGDIAEIILVRRALTNDERQQMEGYLAHKWGLAADLPAGHPYKDASPTVGGVGNNEAQLIVHGNIIQNVTSSSTVANGLELYKITTGFNADTAYINLIVSGTGSHQFQNSGGPTPRLWKLKVDKGTDISSGFTFNTNVTLAGPANEPVKPVNIRNGLLKFNHSGINITLTSGGGDFVIPASGGLELSAGNLKISGPETGMLLIGSLKLNGGSLKIGDTEGQNNFIEYGAAGLPKITVTGGTLQVGSQIRRGLSSTGGALDYRQSGGNVIIGRYSAPTTNRGMLEVVNSGSRFDHTGGTITFVRGVSLGSTPSLLLVPDNSNMGGAAEITIGSTFSPAGAQISNFGINANIPLNKLTLNNDAGHDPRIHLITSDLVLSGKLSIAAGAEMICGDRNLTLKSDVTNDGLLSSGSGRISFIHNFTSTVNGSGTFDLYDLQRAGGSSGTTNIDVDLLVNHNFSADAGTIQMGVHSLTVKGDAMVDGSIHFDPASDGLIFYGDAEQHLSRSTIGGSTFVGAITIDNPSGVSMTNGAGYTWIVDKNVFLKRGVFNLAGNLLEMNPGADFVEVNPYNESNMISTGGAFTNYGVKINVPANSHSDLQIPLGIDKYMPVNFDFSQPGYSSGTANSSYLVKLNAQIHPIISDDIETPPINDFQNVLGLYFSVDAAGIGSDLRMDAHFHYAQSYVNVTSPYTEENYYAARVYNGDVYKFDSTLVDDQFNLISFNFNNVGSGSVSGDYFAGVNAAIPDIIPKYHTNTSGNVDGDTYVEVNDGAPYGADVYVENSDVLTLNMDGVNFYRTFINSDATVKVDATSFHRLGKIYGDGTIHLVGTGNLPAGDYSNFLNCDSGKVVFEGQTGDAFEILASVPGIRRVSIIGASSSSITFANNGIHICNDLNIDGPQVQASENASLTVQGDVNVLGGELNLRQGNITVLGDLNILGGTTGGSLVAGNTGITTIEGDLNLSGKKLGLGTVGRKTFIHGNLTRTSGNVTGGTGGAKLVFSGTFPQIITGNFTQSAGAKIPYMEMNNPNGLLLNGNVDISDTLKLSSGNIYSSPAAMLKLISDGTDVDPVGGSTNSFVDGPMQWYLLGSTGERLFPVGKSTQYRPLGILNRSTNRMWEVEYYDTIATVRPEILSMTPDPTNVPSIETISLQEFWRVNSGTAATTSAKIRLSWGDSSLVSTNSSDQSKLLVMGYNPVLDQWDSYGYGGSSYNAPLNQGRLLSHSAVSFTERFLTLGSSDALNPLPVTWLYFKGETKKNHHVLTWATSSERNTDYYLLERSMDAVHWTPVAEITAAGYSTATNHYRFVDPEAPYGLVYYRLKQIDFDMAFEYAPNIVSLTRNWAAAEDAFDFILYPNPTRSGSFRMRMSNVRNVTGEITIYDLSGKLLKSVRVPVDGQATSAPVQCAFEPGIYLVTVVVGSEMKSKPLVISR